MIKNLPRQLLWTDMTNNSEVKSNKLCKLLDAALSLDPKNSKLLSDLGEEKVLLLYNEAFYLSTRVVYEHDAEACPDIYMNEIIADLGDIKLAKSVVLCMFYVLLAQPETTDEVILFTDKLQKKYLTHSSSQFLNWYNKRFKPGKNNVGFRLKPCPFPADKLQDFHLDWSEITHGYSKKIINEILDLWESEEERNKVKRLIVHARTSNQIVVQSRTNNDIPKNHKQPRNNIREYIKDSARTDEIIAKLHYLIGNKAKTAAIQIIIEAMWIDLLDMPSAPSVKEEFHSIACSKSYINRKLKIGLEKPKKGGKIDDVLLGKIREKFEQCNSD